MGEHTVVDIPNIYEFNTHGTAPKFNRAFQKGIVAVEGVQPNLIMNGVRVPGPVALWGEHRWFRELHKAIAEGVTWYYGDHAYFGRHYYYRITKNALQIDAKNFDADPAANATRFAEVSATLERHKTHSEIAISPVSNVNPDGFVMVCPPSEPLSERSGFTQAEWTKRAVKAIKRATSRPIQIRKKPKVNYTPAPFLQAMRGAWCAVTYTGNVATEAMLGGWPCITTGPHPASVFGNTEIHRIESVQLPPPDVLKDWAGFLCRNQWTLAELAAGKAWEYVR